MSRMATSGGSARKTSTNTTISALTESEAIGAQAGEREAERQAGDHHGAAISTVTSTPLRMSGQYWAIIAGLKKVSTKRSQAVMALTWSSSATNARVRLSRGRIEASRRRRPLLDDLALVHEDDAVGGIARKAQLVADDQHGHAARPSGRA